MHIAIEAERANNPLKTGVEYYAKALLEQFAGLENTHTYTLFLRTKPESWLLSLPKYFFVKVIPFPLFWTQLRISWECLIHSYDRLFIPASALPIFHPKHSVVTIHDIAWWFYPETFTWFNRNFLWFSTWFAVKFASKIIAVSESTKNDLQKYFHIPESKISVVYHGFAHAEEPVEKLSSELADKIPAKYLLFISTLQPRKNLEGLIKAFTLAQKNGLDEYKLVVVGKVGWKSESILQILEAHKDKVVYVGHVSERDRNYLLQHTSLLVLPSFYEGFGMTLLEGFAAGAPVATSNVSSMPEVAGDAAIYFDPHDITSMSGALVRVLTDSVFSEELRQKGFRRLAAFSWEKCAKETLAVIEQA